MKNGDIIEAFVSKKKKAQTTNCKVEHGLLYIDKRPRPIAKHLGKNRVAIAKVATAMAKGIKLMKALRDAGYELVEVEDVRAA